MPANSIDDRTTCEDTLSAAVQPLPPAVRAGSSVLLRGRRWRLDATASHTDCVELHLTGTSDGSRRILLWPFDRPVSLDSHPRLHVVRLREWSRAVKKQAALTIDPLTPRSTGTSVDIVPFQLAPAVAMRAGADRILLADEVGLGKTIQAGWIVSDVVVREPDARVLLAVPAALRQQWATEISTRFSLQPAIVDARWLRDAIADLPADVSPWTAPGVYIGSLDFLKRADVADAIARHVWDLLVIDEAHTATAPTDRHAAIERFARHSRRVVSITATPYSGRVSGFASLAAVGATSTSDTPLMFRRSRADVGDARQRRHRFARVRITAVESRLQRLLERYSRDVWNESIDDPDAARLAVTILRKRALSSAAAAGRSLRRRLDLLQGRAQIPRQLALFEDDEPLEDDVSAAALAAPGLVDAAREHRCLAALIAAADAAHEEDSKLRYLRRLIDRLRAESMVIFTEYRDTLMQLAASLPPSLQLHGGLSAAERVVVQRRFNTEGGLLLATDAAAEGLNLHQQCRLVINYELPWNPARLEQRIGRVDRIGQRRTVHALTLTARDTAEDLVLRNLIRRLSRIAAALGAEDRLGAFLNDARMAGIVIGGDALENSVEPGADDAAVAVRDDGDLRRAIEAAEQLAAHRAAAGLKASAGTDVLVSGMRARAGLLSPGYVVAVWTTARTSDGFLAGARQFVIHCHGESDRPKTAMEMRRIAEQITSALDLRAAVPGIDAWFGEVARAHQASISARLARERELLERPRERWAVQPGLFDRRALAEAELMTAADEDRLDLHRRAIDALERSRPLELTCAVCAVLILWR
jgi:superfamily II DNA or RNA helicase